MPVYSPTCIDETAGFDLIDSLTGKIYAEDEARQQPQEIKSRLVMRWRKIGRWVMTIEECEECLRERREKRCREESEQL